MATPLGVAGEEMLPHCVTPQGCRAQVTPLPAGSFVTVATILGTVPLNSTLLEAGVTVTTIARTVMVSEAEATGSDTEVAVRVTGKSLAGGVGGAV